MHESHEPASKLPTRGSSRLIPLRRPPVVALDPHPTLPPFPPGVSLDTIDAAWAGLQRANPRYHDGELLHVLGVSRNGHGGATIHAATCSYRMQAVRRAGIDLGLAPLGVKGCVRLVGSDCRVDGDRLAASDRWVMGRRSAEVATYAGLWEFVPGGSMTPEIAPDIQLAREWSEETGLARPLTRPVVRALLWDAQIRTWDIVYTAECAEAPLGEAPRADASRWEYTDFACLTPEEIVRLGEAGTLSPTAHTLLPLTTRPRTRC